IEVPVIVKSANELAAIISENPVEVAADLHSRYLVAFVQDTKALLGLAAIESLVVPPEQFAIGKNAAYLFCAAGILESKAGEASSARRASRPPQETGQPSSSCRHSQVKATP